MVQLELDEFYLESRFIFKPEIILLDSVMGMVHTVWTMDLYKDT